MRFMVLYVVPGGMWRVLFKGLPFWAASNLASSCGGIVVEDATPA